ncbi:hypothetical protein ACM91E_28495 [Escherichia coli]
MPTTMTMIDIKTEKKHASAEAQVRAFGAEVVFSVGCSFMYVGTLIGNGM